MGCFVVAEFLLTSASCDPSAIAEPLVFNSRHSLLKEKQLCPFGTIVIEVDSVLKCYKLPCVIMEGYYLRSKSGLVQEAEGMEETPSTEGSVGHVTTERLEEGSVSVDRSPKFYTNQTS